LRFDGTSIAIRTPAISMPRTVDLPIISPKFLAPNARAVSFSHDSDVHLIGNSGVLIYTQTVNIQK
ncbi:MAG: hypothetical protein VCB43_09720, partial [Myxococcota bacterium]